MLYQVPPRPISHILIDTSSLMANTQLSLTLLTTLFVFGLVLLSESLVVEKHVLLQLKKQLKDPSSALDNWGDYNSPCNFSGVSCDPASDQVTEISLVGKSLSGELSPFIFYLPGLTRLVLTSNSISGNLPHALMNATSLRELDLSDNSFAGEIPDLSALINLEVLDLSQNYFSGEFPRWVGELSGLTSLGLAGNPFNEGEVPENIGKLKNLTLIYLADCNFRGEIPDSIFQLSSLQTLDFSTNKLSGIFPKAITTLRNLVKIELYSNNFTGEIPPEFENLTLLREFDISKNQMTGTLPPQLGNLKHLVVFQLYENYFTGEFPKGFGELQNLVAFSIYKNQFSGEFPENFGRFSPLGSIDISENQFSGGFPKFLCEGNKLQFLLALDNDFSGELPNAYANCKSLERLRISQNELFGRIPDGVWGLPKAKIVDFSDNRFVGGITSEIEISASLNTLLLQNNEFSGELPVELGKVLQLQKLMASNNSFTGKIPSEIGNLNQLSSLHLDQNSLSGPIPPELSECSKLVDLNLAENSLSGHIPEKLSLLNSLNSLNLSKNMLSGSIPDDLQMLKLSFIDFSANQFSGRVPPQLLMIGGEQAFYENNGLCEDTKFGSPRYSDMRLCNTSQEQKKSMQSKVVLVCIFSLVMVFVLAGLIFVSYRSFMLDESLKENNHGHDPEKDPNWTLESFHQTEFDVEDMSNLEEENLIGSGSTGRVYRLALKKSGNTFAVKQLWKGTDTKVLAAEMEILGKIRHRNILKLYACLSKGASNFLVFEYMTNGNLFQALQREIKGGQPELDWVRRYQIAVGAAKGLSYLHHDCSPAIIHRDIKSSNILLDEDYEAKIADFGIAKIVEESTASSDSSCFAGTHGYIAPELAYSLKVTEKSDVYSFGVVLLELVTGRRPLEHGYGEGKDIVYWVSSCINDRKDVLGVLDKRIRTYAEEDMTKVLKVAVLCTTKLPSVRPSMREAVKFLLDADPSAVTPREKITSNC
ncbi:receptor protein-tyrosine kinase CEPR2-like isoform X2 [Aristolochia californica]|uniref:receptor protein-tyrosine kinase CEPR2-like isoform X2 n=1 Tax=Aristolochia californica TaxID=171875 RepID=UPI0035DE004A